VRSDMVWSIYEIIHIWTAVVDEAEENKFSVNLCKQNK